MTVGTLGTMQTTRWHLMEDTWRLGLFFRTQWFPCPFDFPFGGDLTSAFFGAAFDGGAAAALALVGAAGAALAGTAGVFAFGTFADLFVLLRDCSIDLALASSLSSTKNSCNIDHKKSKSRSGKSSAERLISSITLSKRLTVLNL